MIAWLAKEADRSHACVTFFPPDAVINKSSVDVLVLTVAYSTLVNVSAVVINICFHCVNLQRYIALEDSQDGEKKDLQCRLVTLESHTRQLELKTRNYADQSKLNLRFICNDTHTHTHPVNSIHSLKLLWMFIFLMCHRTKRPPEWSLLVTYCEVLNLLNELQ